MAVVGFLCPMDKDVKSPTPGRCPRCGMKLVANLPEPMEYRLELKSRPVPIRHAQPLRMELALSHPKTGARIREYEMLHERPFHLFLVSQDLSYFAHEHPTPRPDGSFVFDGKLPLNSAYRLVADCFPKEGTPQFLAKTIFTAGADLTPPPRLEEDLSPKSGPNLRVELATEPARPIAGKETLLFFRLSPGDGVEQYLAAWGHMLVASWDLIDLVHDHPLYVDGVSPVDFQGRSPKQVQFNVIFPREGMYRVWTQFQRAGMVNTVAFTLGVSSLK